MQNRVEIEVDALRYLVVNDEVERLTPEIKAQLQICLTSNQVEAGGSSLWKTALSFSAALNVLEKLVFGDTHTLQLALPSNLDPRFLGKHDQFYFSSFISSPAVSVAFARMVLLLQQQRGLTDDFVLLDAHGQLNGNTHDQCLYWLNAEGKMCVPSQIFPSSYMTSQDGSKEDPLDLVECGRLMHFFTRYAYSLVQMETAAVSHVAKDARSATTIRQLVALADHYFFLGVLDQYLTRSTTWCWKKASHYYTQAVQCAAQRWIDLEGFSTLTQQRKALIAHHLDNTTDFVTSPANRATRWSVFSRNNPLNFELFESHVKASQMKMVNMMKPFCGESVQAPDLSAIFEYELAQRPSYHTEAPSSSDEETASLIPQRLVQGLEIEQPVSITNALLNSASGIFSITTSTDQDQRPGLRRRTPQPNK